VRFTGRFHGLTPWLPPRIAVTLPDAVILLSQQISRAVCHQRDA
jgi:hypothetical protein